MSSSTTLECVTDPKSSSGIGDAKKVIRNFCPGDQNLGRGRQPQIKNNPLRQHLKLEIF